MSIHISTMRKQLDTKDIQSLSLEILLDVHEFCEKNGIALYRGTTMSISVC